MFPFIPLVAYAQIDTALSVRQLVYKISLNILNPLIKLGFAVALLYFIWGVFQYIRDRNSGFIFEENDKGKSVKKGDGANRILWGLFGLFIMVSAFGILRLMKTIIGSDIIVP